MCAMPLLLHFAYGTLAEEKPQICSQHIYFVGFLQEGSLRLTMEAVCPQDLTCVLIKESDIYKTVQQRVLMHFCSLVGQRGL